MVTHKSSIQMTLDHS